MLIPFSVGQNLPGASSSIGVASALGLSSLVGRRGSVPRPAEPVQNLEKKTKNRMEKKTRLAKLQDNGRRMKT